MLASIDLSNPGAQMGLIYFFWAAACGLALTAAALFDWLTVKSEAPAAAWRNSRRIDAAALSPSDPPDPAGAGIPPQQNISLSLHSANPKNMWN
jgi:hypothetical protein